MSTRPRRIAQSNSARSPADKRREIPHRIIRCNYCGELLGTRAAVSIHHPGDCRTTQTMRKAGAWQGYAGVWWTPDLGWDDESLGQPIQGAETRINTGAQLGKTGGAALRPRNGVFTKFRKTPETVH
jgi:hypothetical protein